MLRTRVKASQVTNLTDARYFSAWEVEWIGFNLEEGTANFVQPSALKEMRGWLEGPKIVGEFAQTPASEIEGWMELLQLDAIQLGHFATIDTAKTLSKYSVIKEIVIKPTVEKDNFMTILADFSPHIEAFILNFSLEGGNWANIKNGNFFPLSDLKSICETYPVLLQLDMKPTEVQEVLDTVQPLGLCFTGGEEEKVGFKSFDEIDEIIEELFYEEA